MREVVVFGISFRFRKLFPCEGQIAHVLLTRSPLVYSRRSLTARLACVKHAASVRPEPGSNSPLKSADDTACAALIKLIGVSRQERLVDPEIDSTLSYQRNRQTTRPRPGPGHSVDGALINSSSTFGTLLSSQGSCAHRSQASRPGLGATRQNLPELGGAVKSASWSGSRHHTPLLRARKRPKIGSESGGHRGAGRPSFRCCRALASRRFRRGKENLT